MPSLERQERSIARTLRRRRRRGVERAHAEYAGSVFGYLQGALGDRGAAEDMTQQVFLEIGRRGREYDPSRAGLFTWVMGIARAQAGNRVPWRSRELDDLLERWRVAHLLGRIPADEADLLRMRFHAGLSQHAIAEAAGVPLETVRVRMVKALSHLHELIAAESR